MVRAGSDLPIGYIGYIGLSLGARYSRGPPANCSTHRVKRRYM